MATVASTVSTGAQERFGLSENFFLIVSEGKLVLWDYSKHEQFEIFDDRYFNRILEVSRGAEVDPSDAIDADLIGTSVFVNVSGSVERGWKWDKLSEIFHTGTKHTLAPGQQLPIAIEDNYSGYLEYCESIYDSRPEMETEKAGPVVSLPQPSFDDLNQSLWSALTRRKVSRTFYGKPVPVQTVANVLYATFADIHGDHKSELQQRGITTVGYRRSSPSAGSLQACEAYLLALRVDGIPAGLYHYRSHKHELSKVAEKLEPGLLGGLLSGQTFSEDLAFGVFITCRFDKLWWKYPHSRAYRSALMDVGHLSQTFLLAATSHGLQTWVTGYFYDEEINEVIQIRDTSEQVLFFVGAGIGNDDPLAAEVLDIVEKATSGFSH